MFLLAQQHFSALSITSFSPFSSTTLPSTLYPASTSSAYFKTASQLSATQAKCSVYPIRAIQPSEDTELKKPMTNAVISLAIETVEAGYAALVFSSARQGCQATALMLSEAMPSPEGSKGDIVDRRKEVLSDLRSPSVGLDDTLEKTIIDGVAFHRRYSHLQGQ